MKKLLLIAAVVIASVSAHASKARLEALQNAAHIYDIRNAFDGEAEETVNYEAAIVEFGDSNNANSPNAEGGFVRKMGDSALGFYIGKPSETYKEQAGNIADGMSAADTAAGTADNGTAAAAALKNTVAQRNPVIITYGSKMGGMAWGAGIFMSSTDKKTFSTSSTSNAVTETVAGKLKQNIYGIYGGVNNGVWDAQLRLGLQGETKFTATTGNTIQLLGTTGTLKGTSTKNVKLSGGYHMDTMYFYGYYETLGGEAKINGTKIADTSDDTIKVGVINSHKKDGVDFFYGASVISETRENKKATTATAEKKAEVFSVPVIAGVEGEATSWLVLRGAISQNLPFISTSKIKTGTVAGKSNTSDANTTTTVGAGIKWGKATIDTVLGMGGDGNFGFDDDGDNFAQASLTYNF